MDAVDVMRRTPFLAAASLDSLRRLAGRSTWHHLSRGEFLFHAGEPVTKLYVIASGRVAATISSRQGTPLLFHVATAGESPGQVDLLRGSHDYSASAQALSTATVLGFPAAACLELLESEPAATLVYARDLAWVISVLTDSMADLVFLDLEHRLALTLVETPADGDVISLTLTQSELAARLGVARQSLNQALAKLAGRGHISIESGRTVRIIDRAGLEAFVVSGSR